MRNKIIFYFALPSIIILAGFFSFFLNYDRVINFDWGFFNSFSHLLKSIILEYHRFPTHDPWVCGGVDILGRPQNWVFSPFIIPTLLLSPYVATLFSLIFMSFIGCWAMYKLLKHYNVSDTISIYCSLLFINSGWFGQHIAEGHIAFRSLFLLPLVIYLVLTLNNIKKFFLLSLIMAYVLVDGGFYAFIYSLVIGFLLLILNMVPIKTLFSDIVKNWIYYILATAAFFLVSSAKIIPVLTNLILRERIEQYHMTLKQIAISLFYPLQTVMYLDIWSRGSLVEGSERFHEYGCYIGIISLLIIIWYIRKKAFWKNNIKEIILMVIFLWLATGFGGDVNPGTILKKIPFINNSHVESRYFVVFMLFYILILARVLNRNVKSKLVLIIILAVLNVEYLFVKNYPSFEIFDWNYNQIQFPTYITKRKITQTVRDVHKPEVYLQDNIASKICYEATAHWTFVQHVGEKNYKGEVYPMHTTGKIEVIEFSPGFISAKYDLKSPDNIVFNTNSHKSWVANEPNKVLEDQRNLLTVLVPEKKGVLNLYYRPPYLTKILVLYSSGVIIYLLLLWRLYFKK